jgi:hypothetical protein
MDISKFVAEIDAEIASLQQARSALLRISDTEVMSKPKRGRPFGTAKAVKAVPPVTVKRNLTPEGRQRIADAMKRRWADRAKVVKKASAAKKAPVKV